MVRRVFCNMGRFLFVSLFSFSEHQVAVRYCAMLLIVLP